MLQTFFLLRSLVCRLSLLSRLFNSPAQLLLLFSLKSSQSFIVKYTYHSRIWIGEQELWNFCQPSKKLLLISLLKKFFVSPLPQFLKRTFAVPVKINYVDLFTYIGEPRRQQAIQTRNQIPTPHQSRPTMKYQVCLPINPDP
jgi:hypothetical protein